MARAPGPKLTAVMDCVLLADVEGDTLLEMGGEADCDGLTETEADTDAETEADCRRARRREVSVTCN